MVCPNCQASSAEYQGLDTSSTGALIERYQCAECSYEFEVEVVSRPSLSRLSATYSMTMEEVTALETKYHEIFDISGGVRGTDILGLIKLIHELRARLDTASVELGRLRWFRREVERQFGVVLTTMSTDKRDAPPTD